VRDALLMLSVTLDAGTAVPQAAPAPAADAATGVASSRVIAWPEGRITTPVYGFTSLARDQCIAGPAVVASGETSCVVPRGWSATKDQYGAIRVYRS
jgi:N-methylhydantoinase A/oxoprolinase/acetone carboxylase beta subunit